MASSQPSPHDQALKIAIIGAGTIGLSFAALHLTHDPTCQVAIFDPRPDLADYISRTLPNYLPSSSENGDRDHATYTSRLTLAPDLPTAVRSAAIVQEQGPENLAFKTSLWPQVEARAPADALLWSSTSGIPASAQQVGMRDATRLLVVHPYNPPHVMPLLELVPAPTTSAEVVARTREFWRTRRGREPVVLQKECTGFVANRLAFALFREACSLVANGVVGVEEVDAIVRASMGPRWAVAGVFKSYHAGGGEEGLAGFMRKIGGTVGECWQASEDDVKAQGIVVGGAQTGPLSGWQEVVWRQAEEAYGVVDTKERDAKTRKVLEVTR